MTGAKGFFVRLMFLVFLSLLAVGGTAQAGLVIAQDLLVDLDARALSTGPISVWSNAGTLGDFTASGDPTVDDVDEVRAVVFDGDGDWFEGPIAPDGLVGVDPTRSIEVWAFNPDILGEETLVSWSHRGGPDGSNMSFNYGTNGSFGAVGHWGSPDIGWNGTPAAGQWHHLAYTYDGTTTRVYADGVEMNSEELGAGVMNTHPGDPIYLATQNPAPALLGSLSLAQVRVHDGVLSAADVLMNFEAGIEAVASDGLLSSQVTGNWNDASTWTGTVPGGLPTASSDVVVDADTVTVQTGAAAAVAGFLDVVNNGAVVIGGSQSLTVGAKLNVVAGTVTLGADAALSVGSGTIPSLTTADNPTLDVSGIGTLTVGNLAVSGGTLTTSGRGTLALDNSSGTGVNLPATANVVIGGGTLRSKGANPLGDATAVTLDGGELRIVGEISEIPNLIQWSRFNGGNGEANLTGIDDGVVDGQNGGLFSLTPSTSGGWTTPTDIGSTGDNYAFMWYGNFHAPLTGQYEIQTEADDFEIFWLDVNQNGDFEEAAGEQLTINIPPEDWNTPHTANVTLTAGETYPFAFAFYENGGGDWGRFRVAEPGGTAMLANPSDPGQDGWWSAVGILPVDATALDLTVTADSTLNLESDSTSLVGAVTFQQGILTTAGARGGISIEAINVASNATGVVGLNPQVPTTVGVINGRQAAVTFAKAGSGTLTLDGSNVDLDNAVIEVQSGTLEMIGPQAWGGATSARLAGGTLLVMGEGGANGGQDLAVAEDLLVSLDANGLPAGALSTWTNTGSLPGDFVASGTPLVENVSGVDAVTFDGVAYFEGPLSTPGLEGGSRSIEVWGLNPSMTGEETMVGWGHRGGPDGSNFSFNYSPNTSWGAVGHWGGPDVGWGPNGAPPVGEWHHLVYTYDGVTTRVYADGVEKNFEDSGELLTHAGNPIRVAGQNTEQGGGPVDKRPTMSIAQVRIHDGVLSPGDIANNYNAGVSALFGSVDMSGIDLTVAGDATFKPVSGAAVNVGSLTLENGIVTTTGADMGIVFGGTTVDAAADAVVGINLEVPTDLGPIDVANPTPVTLVKTGTVDLVLSAASVGASGLGANLTFEARGDRLVGLHNGGNPFDQAGLRLAGGELLLAAEDGVDSAVYDNPLAVEENSTLTAGSGGVGAAGPRTVVLGSAANGVALNDSRLTVRAIDDYMLDLAGPVSGPGELIVSEGNVTLSGGGSVETIRVTGGALSTGADVNVAEMRVTDGTVNTGVNRAVVSNRLFLGDIGFTIDQGNTFAAKGDNMPTAATITVAGGTLSVGGAGGAGLAVADELLVSLNTYDLNEGDVVDTWVNSGDLDGDFLATGDPTVTTVTDINGLTVKAVSFNGDDWFEGPSSIPTMEGNGESRSIEVWIHDTDLVGEETSVAWGHRGGPDGSNMSFNYSTNASWGAVGHWGGGPDLGWGGDGPAETEIWHHLVYTHDGLTTIVYADGEEKNREDATNINTYPGEHIRVGGQNSSAGGGNATQLGTFDIAVVRIHSGLLAPEDILANFEAGPAVDPSAGFIDLPETDFVITSDSTLELLTNQDASFGDLTLASGVTLEVAGPGVSVNNVSAGDGSSVAGTLLVRGALAVAEGIGTLNVEELEFDGDDAQYVVDLDEGGADLIAIETDGFLGGTLALQAIGKLGDYGDHTRTIVTVSSEEGSLMGEFEVAPAAGDHLGSGVFHQAVNYSPDGTSVDVDVFQSAAGDVNGDGEVNNTDLQGILGAGSFGNPGEWDWTQGDFNGNGSVGNDDLQLILATGFFGAGPYAAAAPQAGSLAAVPEPGSLLLLASGVLGLLLWRRRRFARRQ